MIQIVGLISPFFALIGLGFLAGRLVRHPLDGLAWLNVFIIYIALPALFFQLLSKTPVEKLASIGFVAATTLGTFSIFVIGLGIALLRSRGDVPASTIQGLASAYGNIGYMGPGLALVALGPDAAVPVALIFCFDNTLHFVMAPLLMAIGGERRGSAGAIALQVLAKIFTHPFIIATIVGVGAAILGAAPPAPVDRFLGLLSGAAAPCALFAMGVTLALRPLRRVPLELGFIVPLKLVLHPVAVWLLLGLFGSFDPVWVKSAMLLASLPTATNVFVIAQQYDVWVERASAAVLVTTVISAATVTLLLYLIASGMIPADPFAY
ncbi:AEC family transporter [Aurantimonas sp. VKM B-3413]|uniref:AEC family transporter n=1 Tax=Aurantimonas sp. VKM B-3413 TaxID=2779401 RepID=UPI001E61A324|nr:AEC family transporter [Aurantimonas sp. VKM B-3413]MCB8837114.1 AEC family transporter [Aurantimonas sp. VKM B-3413]